MSKYLTSAEEQRRRCDEAAVLVTEYHEKHFSEQGEWDNHDFPYAVRERLYTALTFLRSGKASAIQKANGIIRTAPYMRCSFSPMIALQMLTKYRERLEEDAAEILLDYVRSEMEPSAKFDFDYVGVNDNFPSMATYILIIGGQVLGMPKMMQLGKERLGHFKALLTRRGVASEYNSPTYSPIQLLTMAELRIQAQDLEVREMAHQCEVRIMADLLGHLHKETSFVAGPFSRAYSDDSAAYSGLMRCTQYALFGDALSVNLGNTLFESENGQRDGFAHNGAFFGQLNAVWLIDTTYDCPDELIELAMNKQYPYEMTAVTEFTSSTDMPAVDPPVWPEGEVVNYEYPAGTGRISTYMTADYALGTATHEFHAGGQTDSFHLLYRRSVPVAQQRDIGTVYTRYIINEELPTDDMVLLMDNGRKLGIQHKNTAMMLYKPKPYKQKGVSSMKMSLVFPLFGASIEQVWLGDKKMTGNEMTSEEPCSVFVKDGPVYMAFHPLLLTDHGRRYAVTAEYVNSYLMVNFYNYAGETKDFGMKEMLLTGNGFVVEIGSREENGSFEDFCSLAKNFTVKDEWEATIHSRFTAIRKTTYRKDDLTLCCEYSPCTEGIKQITVNGDVQESPKLSMTGFDSSRLPFLKG